MATVPDLLEYRHGVAVFPAEVLERDVPWDRPGPYSYAADWSKLPEDFFCELIEGHIVMSPGAAFEHQYFSAILHRILIDIAEAHQADAVAAPFDVVLSDDLVLQPDLLYIGRSRRSAIGGTRLPALRIWSWRSFRPHDPNEIASSNSNFMNSTAFLSIGTSISIFGSRFFTSGIKVLTDLTSP